MWRLSCSLAVMLEMLLFCIGCGPSGEITTELSPKKETGIRVGVAQIDITPPMGTPKTGSRSWTRMESNDVDDPLYVKAIVIESRGVRMVYGVFDLGRLGRSIGDRAVTLAWTYPVGYANDGVGYLVTPEAYAAGGYETLISRSNNVHPDGIRKLVEEGQRLLSSLQGTK